MPTAEQFRRWADEFEEVAELVEHSARPVGHAWEAEPIRGGRLRADVAALVADVEVAVLVAAATTRGAAADCRRRAAEQRVAEVR